MAEFAASEGPIDLSSALQSMQSCIKDARYFAAKKAYDTLVNSMSVGVPDGQEILFAAIEDALASPEVQLMLERNTSCENALREYKMETTDDERWVLGLDMFGYRTHYIIEEDHNVLVRIEGSQENLPLFEQLAVIRELQLYKEWVPFCSKSEKLYEVSNTDMIAFMHIWSPLGVSRDIVVQGFGADCLHEDGKIIIIAKSIERHEGATLPEPCSGWFHDRAELKHMSVVFDIKSSESANVVMTMKVNPKIRLPQNLLNFFITRLAGVFLYLQHQKATEVSQNPDGKHALSIKENKAFYYDWLLPKMFQYAMDMNWDLPAHTPLMVAVFEDLTAQAANGDSLAPAIVDMMAAVSAQHEPVAEAAIAR